jgi:hypothetical protein
MAHNMQNEGEDLLCLYSLQIWQARATMSLNNASQKGFKS